MSRSQCFHTVMITSSCCYLKFSKNARHPQIQSNGNNDGTSQNLPPSLKNPPLSLTLTSRNVPTDWLAGVAGPVRLALPCLALANRVSGPAAARARSIHVYMRSATQRQARAYMHACMYASQTVSSSSCCPREMPAYSGFGWYSRVVGCQYVAIRWSGRTGLATGLTKRVDDTGLCHSRFIIDRCLRFRDLLRGLFLGFRSAFLTH
jgi:hypothetical protein